MRSPNQIALLVFVMISVAGLLLQYIQSRFTEHLYKKFPEAWESAGSPGGLFWKPKGRAIWENLCLTQQFWASYMRGDTSVKHLDCVLMRLHNINMGLFIAIALAVLLGMPLLWLLQ